MPYKKVEIKKMVDEKRLDPKFDLIYREVEIEHNLIRRIIEARKNIGLTRGELAERVGMSRQRVSKFERDKHIPKFSDFIRISDALNLEIKIEAKESN